MSQAKKHPATDCDRKFVKVVGYLTRMDACAYNTGIDDLYNTGRIDPAGVVRIVYNYACIIHTQENKVFQQ